MDDFAGAFATLVVVGLSFAFSFGPILLFFVIGRFIEKAHFKSLREREAKCKDIVVTNLKVPPPGVDAVDSFMVEGDVVIAPDYFKTWAAGWKAMIGGRLNTLVTLMERARREALLRMKEKAAAQGADFIVGVRFETANLRRVSNDGGQQQGAAIVEMLCYGTAIKRRPATT